MKKIEILKPLEKGARMRLATAPRVSHLLIPHFPHESPKISRGNEIIEQRNIWKSRVGNDEKNT